MCDDNLIYKDVTDKEKTVTIIVRLLDENEGAWELSIRGKGEQVTTWTEWFSSSKEAMDAGMRAILEEGVGEFYSDPAYEYDV